MGDVVGVCYTERDFIDYLNKYNFKEQAYVVATFPNVYVKDELPKEYIELPYFNF